LVGLFILSPLHGVGSDFLSNAERIWTVKFFVSAERTREGQPENKWLFSLELANNSTPAWVDADLLVPRHSDTHQATNSDRNEPVFSIPVGCVGHALQPGPENAIKVRLDNGPMRLHWVNEFVDIHPIAPLSLLTPYRSMVLLDAEGTLHAELHVRLAQPVVPPVPALSPDNSDAWSQGSSVPASHTTHTSSSSSEMARPPTRGRKKKQTVGVQDKPVYTSLRKGGRLR
jgi:hypothetical protein